MSCGSQGRGASARRVLRLGQVSRPVVSRPWSWTMRRAVEGGGKDSGLLRKEAIFRARCCRIGLVSQLLVVCLPSSDFGVVYRLWRCGTGSVGHARGDPHAEVYIRPSAFGTPVSDTTG